MKAWITFFISTISNAFLFSLSHIYGLLRMYVCCESCLQRPGWDSCRQHWICKSGDFVHTHLTEKLRVLREKAESNVDVNEVTESDRSQDAAQCSSDGWVMTGLWTANDSLRSEVSSPGMFLTPWKRGRLTHPSGQMTGKYLGMWISGKQQQRGTRVQVKVKWRSTNKYLGLCSLPLQNVVCLLRS